ncbi:MAG: DUF58 domain-containing protein [Deltaproteobacteria bacterium]|nr:DUF58 domain-containing protein [Deltaproteobacteria bacterium]
MIPTGRLALLFLLGVPALVLARWLPGLGLLTVAYDAFLLVAMLLEARRLRRCIPSCERAVEPRLVLGAPNRIRVKLHNPTDRRLRVRVRDDLPASWTVLPEELEVELPPYARRELCYTAEPDRRGEIELGDVHLRVDGGAGLCTVPATIPAARKVRVYPDVLGPRRYELAARLGDLAYLGFRSIRRDGGGGEFEKLREYVAGDDFADIDWKATARRERPITRVYQKERSQQVLLCVDAGRMMATRLGAITKLDHAINAALLTAHVALRQGDRVGLVVFADDVRAFVPPRRGAGQYRRILDALYPVEPELTFVDFRRFFDFVRLRVPRRALIVVFSDLLDEAHAMPLCRHVGLVAPRHLPLCVTMRDDVVLSIATQTPESAEDAFRRVAAADLVAEEEALASHLAKRGVQMVEASAGELAVATVNRYLEIKRRGAL